LNVALPCWSLISYYDVKCVGRSWSVYL
jgi:hypothetical protein